LTSIRGFNHLEGFREKLENRSAKGVEWYEIASSISYYEEFAKPKLIWPDISKSNQVSISHDSELLADTCFFLPTNDPYLYGLLNSKVLEFVFKATSTIARGGFFRYKAQYVERLPVPEGIDTEAVCLLATKIDELANERNTCELRFSRRLSDLCSNEVTFKLTKNLERWWLLSFQELQKEIKKAFKGVIPLAERNDWQDYFESEQRSREEIQKEIDILEEQLNQEVYKLFNLTGDEIALIETEEGV
jgi:hypothetical protein